MLTEADVVLETLTKAHELLPGHTQTEPRAHTAAHSETFIQDMYMY